MALTSLVGYEWLQNTIKADATLASLMNGDVRCYQRNVPDGTPTYPLILLRFVSGIPLMTVGALDVYTNALFDVIVVSKDNSTNGMKPIANRLDTLLNRASGSTGDGTVFFCWKSEDHSEIATTDPPSPGGGARIQNLGRSWRLTLR